MSVLSTLARHSGKVVTVTSLGSALLLAYWARTRALNMANFKEKFDFD